MPDSPACGVLVVDKPAGPTSFEVVSRVKRLFRARKAGHAGTLDPLATGVLAVCVGEAVKLQQYLSEGDKSYEALVAFGVATATADAAGAVVARGDPSRLDEVAIRVALARFQGEIEQVPPMFSAVRIGGRRLHEAARAGEEIFRPARRVKVYELALLAFAPPEGGLASARVALRCSKGTYVRALAADLGAAVGVPAHLASLRRTAAGPFVLAEAIALDRAEELGRAGPVALLGRLVSPAEALRAWPVVSLSPGEAQSLLHGQPLRLPSLPRGLCRALDGEGRLLALCEGVGEVLRPVRVFAQSIDSPR